MLTKSRAIELVSKLYRTGKYPNTEEGVADLAKGLQRASDQNNIGAGRIIERCLTTCEFCPSDAEMFTIAASMAREDAVAAGTYDSMANAANSFSGRPPCAACENTGWETIYTLHTPVNGDWRHAKRENITQAAYDEISRNMNAVLWEKQRVYSGSRRCKVCSSASK